ncbi:hypothetical protein [Microcystis aeruginosa]|uniref:hypothetical protein n=1 Tax=Microcystis aeruginosa TaxID=1126 RepID=UPI0018AD2F5D|nr:hypothetical protein [Microcystis aeruginosa]
MRINAIAFRNVRAIAVWDVKGRSLVGNVRCDRCWGCGEGDSEALLQAVRCFGMWSGRSLLGM